MEISIYANFVRVYGQICSRYPNIISCFLKWNIKGTFSIRIITLKFFNLKLVKNTIVFTQNKNQPLDMFIDVLTHCC